MRREAMEASPAGKRWRGRVRGYLYGTARRTHDIMRPTWPFRLGAERALTLELTELTVSLPDLPASFDGYRILHLTDLHLDNILFDAQGQPVFLDWSRPRAGPLALNLADLLFGMIPLQLFDSTFDTYLDAFNRRASDQLSRETLEQQLGGAFLRKFAMRTCGIARWQPTLPRAIESIDNDLRQVNESVEFWRERDPELFSFLNI